MPKARVVKGGWFWKGEPMEVGAEIVAPSAEWIANRVADGGLVEAIAEPQEIESAVVVPAETATINHTPVSSGLLGAKRRGNQRSK